LIDTEKMLATVVSGFINTNLANKFRSGSP